MIKQVKFDFEFDDFQKEAIDHISSGKSVVVCAPTGAGKTVIAEYAVNIAIEKNKRLFYTTPLKALSNQKFRDFQDALGEENVGLLTGDISINRDAPVTIMTTEVFRNMLYGTSLGKVEESLKNVSFVVLDECHYMNDSERGTVWEESIIYCPSDIQIIALSATIANADELTEWISTVHGNVALVNSSFRPVPLRHFYFINNQVLPLISPGNKVNQKIKKMSLNKSHAYRKNKMTATELVSILDKKEMLPAIYFCFSRKKCDDYLIETSKIKLLTEFEERRLAQIIDEYLEENKSLTKHKHLEYIYSGVASHHAGLLPGWKILVEKLFQQGLIKVVFATETLAAGINMPARTTIISNISKRTDDGHRNLTASEFLQMSGRAGRRGMDTIGYVVTVASPFNTISEVVNLALSNSDPLVSQFKPSYSMVLNLLQRFNLENARRLILSSFGYYSSKHRLSPLYNMREQLENDISSIENFNCPYNKTNEDLKEYHKNKEKFVELKRLYNILKKQARRKPFSPEVGEYHEKQATLLEYLKTWPCYTCDLYKKHIKDLEFLARLKKRLASLNTVIEHEKDLYWNQCLNISSVLSEFEQISDNYPTDAGKITATFRCENELFIYMVIKSGILDELTPAEIASVFCCLISEEPRGNAVIRMYPSKNVRKAVNDIFNILKRIAKVQKKYDIEFPLLLNIHMAGAVETWASGAEWETITAQTSMDEGDIVRTIKRTIDILRQVAFSNNINPLLTSKCKIALDTINREPIVDLF